MSFILEALKRSEAERQRQQPAAVAGPVLADTPPPRPRNWGPWLALVLLINVVLLVALFWPKGTTPPLAQRGSAPAESRAANDAAPQAASPTTSREPAPAAKLPPSRPGALADEAGYGRDTARKPRETAAAVEPKPATEARASGSDRSGQLARARPSESQPEPARTPVEEPAPALRAENTPPPTEAPLLAELPEGVRAGIPPIPVNIHVYAPEPASRFVLIDMRRYTEGDTLQSGPRLEAITADGLVLEHQGRRFRIRVR